MRNIAIALAALLAGLTAYTNATAQTHDEGLSDAGDGVSTFWETVPSGTSTIVGNLAFAHDVDMYALSITGGGTFSATVTSADFDTQLFLFDSSFLGVYANDQSNFTNLSTLPAMHPLTPTTAGTYYLAISMWDVDPVSGFVAATPPSICLPLVGCIGGSPGSPGSQIFPDSNFDVVVGPTGPGGASPLNHWQLDAFVTTPAGAYTIELTGVAGLVPEPQTYALLLAGLGLLGLGARRSASGRLS